MRRASNPNICCRSPVSVTVMVSTITPPLAGAALASAAAVAAAGVAIDVTM
jgi:hypothetical protein